MVPERHSLHTESLYEDETLRTGQQVSLALKASACAQCSVEILSSLSGVVMKLLAAILEVCSSVAFACTILSSLTGLKLNTHNYPSSFSSSSSSLKYIIILQKLNIS